jgi:hypothetical protein
VHALLDSLSLREVEQGAHAVWLRKMLAPWPGGLWSATGGARGDRSAERRAQVLVGKGENGAGDEIRTHDHHVGNVMLYH